MNLDYSDLFKNTPFSMAQKKKEIWFLERMKILCDHHYKYCLQYRSLTEKVFQPFDKCNSLLDLSFVPANLFKKNNWPIIDVTRKSVEETAASILKIIEIKKHK